MPDPVICRKTLAIDPAGVKPDQRLVSGYISTIDPDMIGDVVLPDGMDQKTYFDGTRSVNLEHDPERPVGTNRNLSVHPGKGVWATTYVGTHALGEDTLTMIREGIIRGMSIEWDPRTADISPPTASEKARFGQSCKRVFHSWTLTRYAFTAQPMNPKCLVDGVKSALYVEAMRPVWDGMERLVRDGKIHRSSAVAAGMPDAPIKRVVSVPVATKRVVNVA